MHSMVPLSPLVLEVGACGSCLPPLPDLCSGLLPPASVHAPGPESLCLRGRGVSLGAPLLAACPRQLVESDEP